MPQGCLPSPPGEASARQTEGAFPLSALRATQGELPRNGKRGSPGGSPKGGGRSGQQKTAPEGGVRYQARENKGAFEKDRYYERQIDRWGSLAPGTRVRVGKVRENSALSKVGIAATDVYFDAGKIAKEMDKHGDHLTEAILKSIPALLSDPVVISEYRGPSNTIENTVSVYGDLIVDNKPVMVGLVMVRNSSGTGVINKSRTIHMRGDAGRLITDDSVLYLNEDKKRTRSWFQVCGISVPLNGTKYGPIRIIAQAEEKSKTRKQAREAMPEDRELLLTAAARAGASAEVLEYRKKVRAMEAQGRRLERKRAELENAERQRETAGDAPSAFGTSPRGGGMSGATQGELPRSGKRGSPGGSPDGREPLSALRATSPRGGSKGQEKVKALREEVRKLEGSMIRYERDLGKMERRPALRKELEKARADWCNESPVKAARVMRQMQEENESLRAQTLRGYF